MVLNLNPTMIKWLRQMFRSEIGPTRAFLVFYLTFLVICAAISFIGPAEVWNSYVHVPNGDIWWDPNLTLDLTIIASIAVVVWTGGVVALQLRGFNLRNAFGMDLLSTTFMACVIAMVDYDAGEHRYLRFIASAFALYYGFVYSAGFRKGWRQDNDSILQWSLNGLFFMVPLMLLVVVIPTEPLIAWFSILTLYFGLQNVLRTLGESDRAMLLRSALVRVNGGNTRHHTWNAGSRADEAMCAGFDIRAVIELPPEERSNAIDAPTHVAYFTKPR